MTYAEKLKDPRWQRKRLQVMEKSEFACEDCGSTTDTLHVHHCYYVHKRQPWEYDQGLMCLCERCHQSRQSCEQDIHVAIALRMRYMTPEELEKFSGEVYMDTEIHMAARQIDWRNKQV